MSFSTYTFQSLDDGHGNPLTVNVNPDTTSNTLFTQYLANINGIKGDLVAASQSGTANSPASLTDDQIRDIKAKLSDLWNTANNGNGFGDYYTFDLTKNLNMLFLSLQMVGIDFRNVGAATNVNTWNAWLDLAVASPVLQSTFDFTNTASNSSLQALIELHYVKTGNDMLSTQLDNMQKALTATQGIMQSLAGLQNAHNNIIVDPKQSLADVYPNINNDSQFNKDDYVKKADALFNSPIVPKVQWPAGVIYPTTSPTGYDQTFLSSSILKTLLNADQSQSSFGQVMQYNGGGLALGCVTDKIINLIGNSSNDTTKTFSQNPGPGTDIFPMTWVYMNPPPSDDLMKATGLQKADSGEAAWIHVTERYQSVVDGSGGVYRGIANITDSPDNYLYIVTKGRTDHPDPPNNKRPIDIFNSLKLAALLRQKNYKMISTTAGDILTSTTDGSDSVLNDLIQVRTGYDISKLGLIYALRDQITSAKASLYFAIRALSAQTTAAQRADSNGMFQLATNVVSDLDNNFTTAGGQLIDHFHATVDYIPDLIQAIEKWTLDNYNVQNSNASGKSQSNITFAITTAENLNTQQQQNVQSFLFLFEEYYKSASAILQQITEILNRMAQHVSQ